jgi:hypothetical protein
MQVRLDRSNRHSAVWRLADGFVAERANFLQLSYTNRVRQLFIDIKEERNKPSLSIEQSIL